MWHCGYHTARSALLQQYFVRTSRPPPSCRFSLAGCKPPHTRRLPEAVQNTKQQLSTSGNNGRPCISACPVCAASPNCATSDSAPWRFAPPCAIRTQMQEQPGTARNSQEQAAPPARAPAAPQQRPLHFFPSQRHCKWVSGQCRYQE